MTDQAEFLPYCRGFVHGFPFPMPQSRLMAFPFTACFKTFLGTNEETKLFLEQLTAARGELMRAAPDHCRVEDKLVAVEQYLPLLVRLQDSWAQRTREQPPVRVDKELSFEWRLFVNGRPEVFRSGEIVFELIMLYHLKALCHYYMALQLLQNSDPAVPLTQTLTECGRQLLSAAACEELLSRQLQPTSNPSWQRKFHPSLPNPPETSANVCAGLSQYFLSLSQATATVRTMWDAQAFSFPRAPDAEAPKSSASLHARLSLGVVTLSESALDILSHSNTTLKPFPQWISEKLITWIAVQRDLFKALSRYSLSQAHYEKNEIGFSIGTLTHAKSFIATQNGKYSFSATGIPTDPRKSVSESFADTVRFVVQKVDSLFALAERDNNFVHFQRIPAAAALPPLPQEAVVAKISALVLPTSPSLVPFVLPPKTSFFGSWFGSSTNPSRGTNAPQTSHSEEVAAMNNASEPAMLPVPPIGAAPLPPFAPTPAPAPSAPSAPAPTDA